MTSNDNDPRRLILFGILAAAITVVALRFLWEVRSTLLLVYVSALFAMGLAPLVKLIERQSVIPIGRRLPRWLAILIIYATVIGAVVLVGAIVVPPLIDQANELWKALPSKLEQAQEALMRMGILRQPITLGDAVQQAPASGSANAVGTIFGAIRNVLGGVLGLVTLLILTFYMLVESNEIVSFFVKLFPRSRRTQVSAISRAVGSKVSAWLGGQLLLALIIGITAAVGLGLMRVPYFYVLALIYAVGEMIPMIGPILAAIPAILVALTVSPGLAIGVTIFSILQQQLENTILVPKIMGRQVGLSAVSVIIALGIGGELLGVAGAILAVPTAAIVQVFVQELLTRDE